MKAYLSIFGGALVMGIGTAMIYGSDGAYVASVLALGSWLIAEGVKRR